MSKEEKGVAPSQKTEGAIYIRYKRRAAIVTSATSAFDTTACEVASVVADSEDYWDHYLRVEDWVYSISEKQAVLLDSGHDLPRARGRHRLDLS